MPEKPRNARSFDSYPNRIDLRDRLHRRPACQPIDFNKAKT